MWFRSGLMASAMVGLLVFGRSASADPVIVASSGEGLTGDLFDVTQGAVITGNSAMGFAAGISSDPRAAFGFTSTFIEPTHTIFENDAAVGAIDFINFQTVVPVPLRSYVVRLQDDSGATPFPDRGSTAFRLYGGTSPGSLSLLSQATILPNYTNSYGGSQISVADVVNGVGLQYFRLEVERATTRGPRIVEIDGLLIVPEPASLILAGLGLFLVGGFAVRRRVAA
jgi:hypothetical protein